MGGWAATQCQLLWQQCGASLLAGVLLPTGSRCVWLHIMHAPLDYMSNVGAHMVARGAINAAVESAALRAAAAVKTVTRF